MRIRHMNTGQSRKKKRKVESNFESYVYVYGTSSTDEHAIWHWKSAFKKKWKTKAESKVTPPPARLKKKFVLLTLARFCFTQKYESWVSVKVYKYKSLHESVNHVKLDVHFVKTN